jgi:uncharacterized low-complexity protein
LPPADKSSTCVQAHFAPTHHDELTVSVDANLLDAPVSRPIMIQELSMKTQTSTAAILTGTLLGSVAIAQLATAGSAFQMADIVTRSALSQVAEGKCGEGRCAANKLDTNHDGRVSYEEAMAAGFSEQQCRAWDKNKDLSLEANELAAMHAILDPPVSHKKP